MSRPRSFNDGNLYSSITLATSQVVADLPEIQLGDDGWLGLQVVIDNGGATLGAVAPSDSVQGTWELYGAARDGMPYGKIAEADTKLQIVKANGNNVVNALCSFVGVPAAKVKVRWVNASGGAGNSRATVVVMTRLGGDC